MFVVGNEGVFVEHVVVFLGHEFGVLEFGFESEVLVTENVDLLFELLLLVEQSLFVIHIVLFAFILNFACVHPL